MRTPRNGDPFGGTSIGRGTRTHRTPDLPNTPSISRTGSAGVSGFDGLTKSRDISGTRTEVQGRSTASKSGFALLDGFRQLKQSTRRAVTASAIGFMLLVPPGVGQLMHPGAPTAASPLALMMSEKSEIPTGARIRAEANQLRAQIPGGIGASRELALVALIEHYDRSVRSGREISALSSDAAQQINALKEAVGLDARMGYAVDLYWFGVPQDHAAFHAGVGDARAIADQASDVGAALSEVRAGARAEVSDLLRAESPEYAALHAEYSHEKSRLSAATRIRDLADEASDALGTASNAITMRNLTPRTIQEDVYETRSTKNADGTTSSERVKTGTRTVDNPSWHTWNTLAIASKARAEGKIRGLNEAIGTHRELLGIDGGGLSADLITAWDFFGQPSFFVWSFDSQDVDRAEQAADRMIGEMNGLMRQIHTVLDPLERQVESRIDARWSELGGKGGDPSRPNPNDDARPVRQSRLRRNEDGSLHLDS